MKSKSFSNYQKPETRKKERERKTRPPSITATRERRLKVEVQIIPRDNYQPGKDWQKIKKKARASEITVKGKRVG